MIYLPEFLAWASMGEVKAEHMREWELVPYHIGTELAALGLIRGTEIHFAAAPQFRKRLIHKQRTREFLAPLFDRYGFLTTRSYPDDIASAKFLSRMGFLRTWSDGIYQHWMLTALPFGKET